MSPHPPRVVPTLTEVLDEGSWQTMPPAASVEPVLGGVDFELDLGFPAAPSICPPSAEPEPPGEVADRLLEALRPSLNQALDQWLEHGLRAMVEQATTQLHESLVLELRQQLAPRLEQMVERAVHDWLQRERRDG